MSLFDDEKPKKPLTHEIGCDISLLSADELKARIDLLNAEINRLQEEIGRKSAGRRAAEDLFRK
ncbi:DUF1192 domain-containing protein [Rhizobium sp. LjRoot30]|uniref:DUF1192 domain-containing protein n=1 Tax=Rhizobium sp. LjRoot30 TaxID=3342320 RepID=UPI003ECF0A47